MKEGVGQRLVEVSGCSGQCSQPGHCDLELEHVGVCFARCDRSKDLREQVPDLLHGLAIISSFLTMPFESFEHFDLHQGGHCFDRGMAKILGVMDSNE